jgi:hypothetical protein
VLPHPAYDYSISIRSFSLKIIKGRAMVAHAFNPSTSEAGAGRFLSSRLAWSIERVLGQPGLHRETLSQKKKKIRKEGSTFQSPLRLSLGVFLSLLMAKESTGNGIAL